MNKFDEARERNLERLELYVPIVARVHGGTHPEFHNVHSLFDRIKEKIEDGGLAKPELDSEFEELRRVTDNYTVPDEVCESYEAVYNMLAEMDEAYNG